jgi:hypothetical protein
VRPENYIPLQSVAVSNTRCWGCRNFALGADCQNLQFAIISDRKAISLQLLLSLSVLEFIFKHIFTAKILQTSEMVVVYRSAWISLSNPPKKWTLIFSDNKLNLY